MATRKAKGMTQQETAITAIAPEIMARYEAWQYTADDAVRLEATREGVLREQRNGIASIVNAGRLLNETKAAIPHGEWGAYILERLRMSQDTAERLMGGARLVESYPRLMDMADRLRPTAIYAMARGKTSDERVVNAVIEAYSDTDDEITLEVVKDAAEFALPQKEAKPVKLPFKLIDAVIAADEGDRLDTMMGSIISRGAMTGLVYDKVLKSASFKAWLKGDGAKMALSFAAYAYFIDASKGADDIDASKGADDADDADIIDG